MPGVVTHNWGPSFLGVGNQKDQNSSLAQSKGSGDLILTRGLVQKYVNRRIAVQGDMGINIEDLSQKIITKAKDWGGGGSSSTC
jgi:hypothetical protein